MRLTLSCLLGMLILGSSACSPQTEDKAKQAATQPPQTQINPPAEPGTLRFLAGERQTDLETVLSELSARRLIFIGENHDRYDHHLNQLALIRRLYESDPRLTLGLEMFQQPAQPYLDAYIAGRSDERELLEKSRYFERWGFDYRLYRPLLQYAREQSIPLLALNVPTETIRQVSQGGLGSLSVAERTRIPQIDTSDRAYRDRLRRVFEQHQGMTDSDFQRFLEVQLLWDEGMAEQAARYLQAHPEQRLIVLAGNGHLVYGSGIPNRVRRRLPVPMAIILQDAASTDPAAGADYVTLSDPVALPAAGRLGVILDSKAEGPGLRVAQVAPHSGAQQAGIQADDRLLGVAGQAVDSMQDVSLALLDKNPGERVSVAVRRDQQQSRQDLVLTVTLQPQ
ncbi:MAG: ChaN family lipoprotein [Candidatus Competibacteraceae bacterium]